MTNKRKKNGKFITGRRIMIVLAVIFFLSAVAISLIINSIYLAGENAKHPVITMLSASDLISYSGALLSGALTIAGVFFTVKYSQTQYKEDMLNRVLPYLTVELISSSFDGDLMREAIYSLFNNKQPDQTDYQKVEIQEYTTSRTVYFMVEKAITIKYNIDDFTKKMYLEGLDFQTDGQSVSCLSDKSKSFFSFNLINSGNGPAANLAITLSKKNDKISTVMFPLQVSQKVYIALCIDSTAPRGEYKLRYEYSNIYGNRYVKEQHLNIEETKGILNMDLYDKSR